MVGESTYQLSTWRQHCQQTPITDWINRFGVPAIITSDITIYGSCCAFSYSSTTSPPPPSILAKGRNGGASSPAERRLAGAAGGTPTKRQVSKRLKRHVYKTSALQNVRFTKSEVYKTSGLQNVQLQKKHPYIFCTCGWWKSAGSVAAMFAGKVMAVFYSLF
jgi:hypothetical protein